MPGAASAEGTRRYAQRAIDQGIPASAYRGLGRTGLVNSSLGFGSYRMNDRAPEHTSALDKALLSGVNLVDTSTNYTDGSSESCIGNVLAGRQREQKGPRPAIKLSGGGLKTGQLTMDREARIAIVCDGQKWHVRRIASIEDDRIRGEMVYRCDQPISSDHDTLAGAVRSAVAYMEREAGGAK